MKVIVLLAACVALGLPLMRAEWILDDEVNCLDRDYMESVGFLINGEIQPEAILGNLIFMYDVAKIKMVQEKCDSIMGTNDCDTAHKLFTCYNDYGIFIYALNLNPELNFD